VEPLREWPARSKLPAHGLQLHVRDLELLLQGLDGAVQLFQLALHGIGCLELGLPPRKRPLQLGATLTLGLERRLELLAALELRAQRPLELPAPHAGPRELNAPLLEASEQLGAGHARILNRLRCVLTCLDCSTIPGWNPCEILQADLSWSRGTLGLLRERRTSLPVRAAIAALAALLMTAGAAPAATYVDSSFNEEELVSGLDTPVQVTWAPDGRMFIAEKDGKVKVHSQGQAGATTLLDISDEVNSYGDRGLLGLAVDAEYPAQPYLYVVYVHELDPLLPDDDGPMVSRLVRYNLAEGAAGGLSNPQVLLGTDVSGPCPEPSNSVDCLPADSSTHTIGTVRSAPDGSLFVGTGDGAEFNFMDPQAFRSLDEQSLAGKVLHVDRQGNGLPGHPFCPATGDLTQVCTKLWAKGFRNPFRFTLRDDGLLVLGDVGWNTYEELNLVGGGKSYGWPCFEGPDPTAQYSTQPECQGLAPGTQTGPDWGYNRAGDGGAMIGGPTYAGGDYPDEYDGAIFAGDYAKARVTRVGFDGGSVVTAPFISAVDFTDLELHPSGDLVYVYPGFGPGQGGVYRVTFNPAGRPTARASVDSAFDDTAPYTFDFSSAGSTNPSGGTDGLTYSWDFGDGTPTSALPDPTHEYADAGPHTATLTVTHSGGKSDRDSVTVHPGNAGPPTNLSVVASPSSYRGGETLTLTGSADDAATLDWTVLIRHDTHIHPVRSWDDLTQISFRAANDHDANSHYEVILTATDAEGATSSQQFPVNPETTGLSLRSDPPGAALSYGGSVFTAPADLTSAIGFRTTISAPERFSTGGHDYGFRSWSDGGARLHDIVVTAGAAPFVASYEDLNPPPPPPPSPPPPPPPGGGSTEPPDLRSPRLTFSARGIAVRRGVLRGGVRDQSAVRLVEVALARRDGRRCRWWSGASRRPGRRADCGRERWLPARLTRTGTNAYAWRLALGRRLADGRWLLLLRATDAAGNTATRAAGRSARLSLRVSRGRASLR
jgi:glucose/arabinose dehydrogenase